MRWLAQDPWAGLLLTHVKAPGVSTGSASNITTSSFDMAGTIDDAGGENCTERGFAYFVGSSGDPTTADSTAFESGSFGAGTFSLGLSGLTQGTSYQVRAYAINSAGTGYGTTVTVTTTGPTGTISQSLPALTQAAAGTFVQPPTTPTNLQAVAVAGAVSLSWASGAGEFRVERETWVGEGAPV